MSTESILSDADFLRSPAPEVTPPVVETPAAVAEGITPAAPVAEVPQTTDTVDIVPAVVDTPPEVADKLTVTDTPEVAAVPTDDTAPPANAVPEGEANPDAQVAGTPEAPNYEELYKQVMAPFKANGKEITLKDPSEVIQLMQMGANYTRNMQLIAPNRKTLMALQQAGIDNQEQLNFLIDLHQKKPEALAKLMADAQINPIDIDTSTAGSYRAGNHQVSDEQVAFQTALDDVAGQDGGHETLAIASNWDDASQQAAFKDPKIISDIHDHRRSGVYDKVMTELNRARVLGHIPSSVPFVNAYGHVFSEMSKAGAFEQPKPAPTPVAVRPVTPKPVVSNSAAANAAATTPPSARAATAVDDLSSLSDADFMKKFANLNGRL